MKKNIAVLPGDGVGPEIIAQAQKVLEAVATKYGHEFVFEYGKDMSGGYKSINTKIVKSFKY